MAKNTATRLGTAQDVFHDEDFQKALKPELDKVVSQIEGSGMMDDYKAFLSERETNETIAQKTLAFTDKLNSENYSSELDDVIKQIEGYGLKEEYDKYISSFEGEFSQAQLTIDFVDGVTALRDAVIESASSIEQMDYVEKEVKVKAFVDNCPGLEKTDEGMFIYKAEGDVETEIPEDVITRLALDPETSNEINFEFGDNDIVAIDAQTGELIEAFYEDENGEYKPVSSDEIQDNADTSDNDFKDIISKGSEGIKNFEIDTSDLKEAIVRTDIKIDDSLLRAKVDELKTKSDKIEEAVDKADKYSYLSYKNVFGQYSRLETMIIAKQNGMKYNGGYVANGDIFFSACQLINNFSLNSIFMSCVEILVYKALDGIESKLDLEKYRETDHVDKETSDRIENHTVPGPTADDIKDVDKQDPEKERPDKGIAIKLDNGFEINKDTIYKFDTKEFVNSDGKVSISDVSDKIRGIDMVGHWSQTDRNTGARSEHYESKFVTDREGRIMIDGKIITRIVGQVKDLELSDSNKAILQNSRGRIEGVDKPSTIGYIIYNVRTDTVEYRDCRFEHYGGERFDIESSGLRFFGVEEKLVKDLDKDGKKTDTVDAQVLDSFNAEIDKRIDLDPAEIDRKIEEINERIEQLQDYVNSELGFSEEDKKALNDEIERLKEDRDEVSKKPSDNLTVDEKISMAETKAEILGKEIETTKPEKDHKSDVDRYEMAKAKDRIDEAAAKIDAGIDVRNSESEVISARREYISHSDLSEGDKEKLINALSVDIKATDIKLIDVEFEDKEKAADVIASLYERELTKGEDAGFRSDVCKEAKDETDKKIEAKKAEVEQIKNEKAVESKYSLEDINKYIETGNTTSPSESVQITEKNDRPESITRVTREEIPSKIDSSEPHIVTRVDVISINKEGTGIEISSNVFVDGSKVNDTEIKSSVEFELLVKGFEISAEEKDLSDKVDSVVASLRNDKPFGKVTNSLAAHIETYKEDIIKALSDHPEITKDAETIKDTIVNAVESSGLDIDHGKSDLKRDLEHRPLSDILTASFEKVLSVDVETDKYKLEWIREPVGGETAYSEGDKVGKFYSAIETAIDITVANDPSIEDVYKSDFLREIPLDILPDRTASPEVNAQKYSDTMKYLESTELSINRADEVYSISGSDVIEMLGHVFDIRPYDEKDQVDKMSPIRNIDTTEPNWKETLIMKQDELAKQFVEGDHPTEEFIACFMASKGETMDDTADYAGFYTNIGAIPEQGTGKLTVVGVDNIADRVDEAIDAIARYAADNPDMKEEVVEAITMIARDTGCISKVSEAAENSLTKEVSFRDRDAIIDICFSKLDSIIDEVYGIERDENGDIEAVGVGIDDIESAKESVINVVTGIVDAILPRDADDIKDKISEVLEKTKMTRSQDPTEAKSEFLSRLKAAMTGIVEKVSAYNLDKADFDVSDIDLDNYDSEYDSIEDAFGDLSSDENENSDVYFDSLDW